MCVCLSSPNRHEEAMRMKRIFETVCKLWNALHESTDGMLAVGACQNGQKFDQISLESSVGTFLTYPDDERNDMLLKV